MMRVNHSITLLLLSLLPFSSAASPLQVTVDGDRETVTLSLPSAAPAKVFALESPPRVVVDMPTTQKPDVALPTSYQGTLITAVRSGLFAATTGRVVMETKPLSGMKTSQEGATLTIHLSAKQSSKAPEKPMIVLDPGHGGEDPGATGVGGTQEKDVVLRYAKALKTQLETSGKYRVILTRNSDYFIRLRDRVKQCRDAKGILFISLHADSSHDAARGLSVYTLSETASDKEAEALATRENRADIIAGMDLSTHDEEVANILISLAQRETNTSSALLADALVAGLRAHNVRLLENTHRFAGFAVLKAPDVPSVLVEIGFLSHPEEEKRVNSARYRDQIVSGLEAGIHRYFTTQKTLNP